MYNLKYRSRVSALLETTRQARRACLKPSDCWRRPARFEAPRIAILCAGKVGRILVWRRSDELRRRPKPAMVDTSLELVFSLPTTVKASRPSDSSLTVTQHRPTRWCGT